MTSFDHQKFHKNRDFILFTAIHNPSTWMVSGPEEAPPKLFLNKYIVPVQLLMNLLKDSSTLIYQLVLH